jgi:hypothetical protein
MMLHSPFRLFAAVLLVALVATAAHAAPVVAPLTLTAAQDDNSSIKLGVLWGDFLTHIRVDPTNSSGFGTSLSLENNLGLKKNEPLFLASATWRATEKQNVDFEYTDIDRSASSTKSQTIVFGNHTYVVNPVTPILTHFDTRLFSVRYRYSFIDQPETRVGAALGIGVLDLQSGVSEPGATAASTGTGVPATSEDITVPVPELGLKLTQRVADQFFFNAYVNYLALKYDSYTGSAADLTAGFDYLFDQHWGLSLDYLYKRWDVNSNSGSFRGNVNYTVSGPALTADYYF